MVHADAADALASHYRVIDRPDWYIRFMRYAISIWMLLAALCACATNDGPRRAVALFYPSGHKMMEGRYDGWRLVPPYNVRVPRRAGHWTFWFENGQKKEEGAYGDQGRDGLWTSWDEDGHKLTEVWYRADEKDGVSILYYANGGQALQMNFSVGRPVGIWTKWDTTGHVTRRVDMKSGQVLE